MRPGHRGEDCPRQVEELLNISGRISGVGDFRPERRGPYGRYRAELVEGDRGEVLEVVWTVGTRGSGRT